MSGEALSYAASAKPVPLVKPVQRLLVEALPERWSSRAHRTCSPSALATDSVRRSYPSAIWLNWARIAVVMHRANHAVRLAGEERHVRSVFARAPDAGESENRLVRMTKPDFDFSLCLRIGLSCPLAELGHRH